MPEVQVTTTIDVDEYVDVDIADILDECSEKELEAVVEYLVDNEVIKANRVLPKYICFNYFIVYKIFNNCF